jgi:ureidoglycolate dehydrogenase (NAD+)
MTEKTKKIQWEDLLSFCTNVFVKVGVSEENAKVIADSLVKAELLGFHSHGVVRLSHYVKRIKIGSINPKPKIRTIKESGNVAIIDGDAGMGHIVAHFAMNQAIRLAGSGFGVAGVRNSSHFGIAGYFALQAAEKNMIGIALTHTDVAVIPFGGKKPAVGTNPIAVAVPTNRKFPIVLDMATSAVALGKIIVAGKKGEKIPMGWAVDENGNPTDEPDKVKYLMPMAGPKGYALSLIIDILCGPLTGALFGMKLPKMYGDYNKTRQLGHFLAALNIQNFVPVDEFKKNIDTMIDDIHNIPPAKGFEKVLLPGEIEYLNSLKHKKEGIPLPEGTLKDLEQLEKELKINFL